jgi:N-hydroxyarylamine O-acetyltransferase
MTKSKMVQEYLNLLNLNNRKLDFSLIADLVTQHVATFAFSSVGCRLGNDLPLDFESLFNRIVISRRGGYCFEQNGLLYAIFEELGFSPKLYLGRVIHNTDTHPGLTHRISMIEDDGAKYIVDAGFGPLGPRVPVPLSGATLNDGKKDFRIFEKNRGEYHMQYLKDGEFFSLYKFELGHYGQADCELGHFYSHKHPEAVFVNNLVVSLIQEKEIRSLRNNEYWIIKKSGIKNQQIKNAEQLKTILVCELGVQVTEEESCQLYKDLDT